MLTLITAAALFVAVGWRLEFNRTAFGLHIGLTARGAVVTAVRPGSPGALAGIRAGDHVRVLHPTLADRAALNAARPGRALTVLVNGRPVTLLDHGPARAQPAWPMIALRLAFLAIAGLLVWRRPADRCIRSLVYFLFAYGLAVDLSSAVLPSPMATFLLLQLPVALLLIWGSACAARFAAGFPSGRAEGALRMLSAAVSVVAAVTATVYVVMSLSTNRDLSFLPAVQSLLTFAYLVMIVLLASILGLGYARSAGPERQRRLWLFVIIGAGMTGPLVDVFWQNVIGYNVMVDFFALITLAIIPFGLAYIILRHRIIDVGFVLNRAVVYGALSLFVVGIFVVVETLLGRYVEQTNHVTSVAVQLAIALLVGFSIRFIHDRVDRAVDQVLFRRRHQAESALRAFTHDAPYITERKTLLQRCVQSVMLYAEAADAGIWLWDGACFRPCESSFSNSTMQGENDPALLAMRARSVIVDLASSGSGLPGVLAFPMTVRGELLGTLVCGAKRDGTGYAPDEREALAALAASVGHACDGLEVRELRRKLAAATAGGFERVLGEG